MRVDYEKLTDNEIIELISDECPASGIKADRSAACGDESVHEVSADETVHILHERTAVGLDVVVAG